MSNHPSTIRINVVVDISVKALETIVQKEKAAWQSRGGGPVDTAGKVGELISGFLLEKDFDRYAMDGNHYEGSKRDIRF